MVAVVRAVVEVVPEALLEAALHEVVAVEVAEAEAVPEEESLAWAGATKS